jgi:acyl carrier protein
MNAVTTSAWTETMGLDLLDLSIRINQRFGMNIAVQDIFQIADWPAPDPDGRPFDVTVGQLYEFLRARLEIVDEGESRSGGITGSRIWMPHEVWDELEEILVECLYVDREDVRPEARLVADLGAE